MGTVGLPKFQIDLPVSYFILHGTTRLYVFDDALLNLKFYSFFLSLIAVQIFVYISVPQPLTTIFNVPATCIHASLS